MGDDAPSEVTFLAYVFWFTLFCITSVSMTIMNKFIMKDLHIPYMVLCFQQSIGVVFHIAMYFLVGRRDVRNTWHIRPVTSVQVRRLCIAALYFTFMLASSLKALPLVSVATVVVFRNCCTCVVAFFEWIVFGKYFSFEAWAAIGLTVLGSLAYANTDITFNADGYFWQCVNSCLFCFGQLYEKWNMSKTHDQTAAGVNTIKSSLAVPIAFLMVPLSGEWTIYQSLPPLSLSLVVLTALSGVGAICLGVIYMTLLRIASATASTVAGNFNKVVSIIVGTVVFSTELSSTQTQGLVACIVGSTWYSVANLQSRKLA